MKYSDNITIQKFIEQLVDALKYENTHREPNGEKLDVPFLVSALWQDLIDNYECYDEFCSDLRDCDSYEIVIGEDNYCICKVNVFLYNETENDNWKCLEEADFRYEITFSYDDGVVQDIRLVELLNKYVFFRFSNSNLLILSPFELYSPIKSTFNKLHISLYDIKKSKIPC